LFIVIALQLAGALWLIASPVLGLRDLPEAAELPARA